MQRDQEDTGGYVAFNERRHGGHRKLLALAGSGGRTLDVGCSSGYLARRLVQQGHSVVGVERDGAAAQAARRWCEDVVRADLETTALPFAPGSFDLIVCADVVEHLREPEAALARLRPLLRSDGRLLITTPNVANWSIRLGLLFGRFQYTDRGILDRTHTRLFTRRTLLEALAAAGYRPLEIDFTAPVPLVGRFPIVEALAHRIASLRPTLLAYQFVVAAAPAWAGAQRSASTQSIPLTHAAR